jgi:hypothetical protein
MFYSFRSVALSLECHGCSIEALGNAADSASLLNLDLEAIEIPSAWVAAPNQAQTWPTFWFRSSTSSIGLQSSQRVS